MFCERLLHRVNGLPQEERSLRGSFHRERKGLALEEYSDVVSHRGELRPISQSDRKLPCSLVPCPCRRVLFAVRLGSPKEVAGAHFAAYVITSLETLEGLLEQANGSNIVPAVIRKATLVLEHGRLNARISGAASGGESVR